MYMSFIFGLTVGIGLGVAFHYWWIQPDIKDLKKHVAEKERQLDLITSYALRNANVRVTHRTVKKVDVKKPKNSA